MRKYTAYLLLFVLCLGCKKEHKLTFEPMQLENTSCQNCPTIKIDVPHALDETLTARNINMAVKEELIYSLNFEEAEDVHTIEEAMASFTKNYHDLQEKFGDESVDWEAEINGEVAYEDKNMITLLLNSYSFTGGAHGYGSTSFLNFAKRNGSELENHQLFKDVEGFSNLAEKLFREKEQIPQGENINSTGFMFDSDRFHLSETIGYTEEGIQLIYNQYEVASYADGPIVLTIPFETANQYLRHKVAP